MNNSQFTINGGPKTAWHNKGRNAALKELPASPPPDVKHGEWYMTGYRAGKKELEAGRARD